MKTAVQHLHSLYTDGKKSDLEGILLDSKSKIQNIDTPDEHGYTLLQKAFANNQPNLALALVKKGAKLFPLNSTTPNCLTILAQSKHSSDDFLEVFRACGAEIQQNLNQHEDTTKALITELYNNKQYAFVDYLINAKSGGQKLTKFGDGILKELFDNTISTEVLQKIQEYDDLIDQNFAAIEILEQSKTSNDQESQKQISALKTQLKEAQEAKEKLYLPSLEKSKVILRITPKTIKLGYLKEAILNGDTTLVEFITKTSKFNFNSTQNLLEETRSKIQNLEEQIKKNSNNLQQEQNLLEETRSKIQNLEEQIKKNSNNLQQEQIDNTLKRIDRMYRSMNFLLKRKDFDFKNELEKPAPDNILIKAYIDFQESNERTRYHKKLFFESLFNHPQTQEYLENHGNELLELAAKYKDKDIFNRTYYLMDQDALTYDNKKLLFNAAQSGSNEIFSNILTSVSTRERNNLITPTANANILMAACSGGNPEIVDKILTSANQFNIDINAKDNDGNTAFHYLSTTKSTNCQPIVSKLLNSGADIEAKNKQGHTPLISAILLGNVGLVKELIAKGADVNAIDKNGNTPLIYAVDLNNKDMIGALLSNNELNVTHQNNKGISAYAISISRDIQTEKLQKATDTPFKNVLNENYSQASTDDIANQYPFLSQTLLRRGADPYQVVPSTMLGLGLTATLASGAVQTIGVLADATKGTMFSGAGGVVKTLANMGASYAVGQAAKKYVQEKLSSFLTQDEEKLDLDGEIMIGSVHRGKVSAGEFTIKTGKSLYSDMKGHNHFKSNSIEGCIFTLEGLEKKIQNEQLSIDTANTTEKEKQKKKFNAWAVRAQKTLQDKYVTLERRIENRGFWARNFDYYTNFILGNETALQNAKQEILEASEKLKGYSGRKITTGTVFENIGKSLIDILHDQEKSKQLLKEIINPSEDNKEKIKGVENIIEDVINKEILVAPDVYSSFCKFAKEKKLILQNETKKQDFISKQKNLDTSDLDNIAKIDSTSITSLKTQINNFQSNDSELNTKNKPKSYQEQMWSFAQSTAKFAISGVMRVIDPHKTDKDNIAHVVETAGNIAAATASTATALQNNPELLQKTGDLVSIADHTLNIGYGIVGTGVTIAVNAVKHPVPTAAVVAAAAAPVVYSYRKEIGDALYAGFLSVYNYGSQVIKQYSAEIIPSSKNAKEAQVTVTHSDMKDFPSLLSDESKLTKKEQQKLEDISKMFKSMTSPISYQTTNTDDEGAAKTAQKAWKAYKERQTKKKNRTLSQNTFLSDDNDTSSERTASMSSDDSWSTRTSFSDDSLSTRTSFSDPSEERFYRNMIEEAKKDPKYLKILVDDRNKDQKLERILGEAAKQDPELARLLAFSKTTVAHPHRRNNFVEPINRRHRV